MFQNSFHENWLNFYPKTLEILFSLPTAIFQDYNLSRSIKVFILMFSWINYLTIVQKIQGKIRVVDIAIGVVLIFNPVVIYQFFTLYIDDLLYLLVFNFVVYFLLSEFSLAIAVLSLAIGSKISYGVFGIILFPCVVLIYRYLYDFDWNEAHEMVMKSLKKWTSITIVVLALFVSGHQYIANTYNYHNPGYGFIGEGKKNIIDSFIPPRMVEKNRFERFVYTYFSYSRNYCIQDDCQKFLTFDREGVKDFFRSYSAMKVVDPNLNGF